MCCTSFLKSISSSILLRMSVTIPAKEVLARSGFKTSSSFDEMSRKLRSVARMSSTPGFSTLSTTSFWLSRKTAVCTWATEAVASGTGLMEENTVFIGCFNSSCMVLLMMLHGTGSVLSRHFWNSSTYGLGKRVGEDATNCPSFMYVAPSFSNSRLRITSGGRALPCRKLLAYSLHEQ